jgi:hypothetical protein
MTMEKPVSTDNNSILAADDDEDHVCGAVPTSVQVDVTSRFAYRTHFSCDQIGRYIKSTKRRMEW